MEQRVAFDAYVIDALMPDLVGHDRRPSAFVVYAWLWRRTRGAARSSVASYRMLADGTGLSKRAVQEAVALLVRRQLIEVTRKSPTASPVYRLVCHWRR
jgi:hypothetical protein